MRAVPPPWRSLVRLAVPVLLVAACAPRAEVYGRPPPCAPGTALCEATSRCIDPSFLDYSKDENRGPKAECPFALVVRQGTFIDIPVPGTTDRDITILSTDDLTADVVWEPPAPATLRVRAAHGTFPGAGTKQGMDRTVKFRTTSGGVTVDRSINVIVSPITAAFGGDDDAVGSTEHPFRTFAHAADVALPGDTIALSNGPNGSAADGEDAPPVTLRPDVTVMGLDEGKTLLFMKVTLLGSATFERIYFKRERLVVDMPKSHVKLSSCLSLPGVEVSRFAMETDLWIQGADTEIRADDGQHEPVLVVGDGSTVRIDNGVHVISSGGQMPAVHLTGQDQDLTIFDRATIDSSTGMRSVQIDGKAQVHILDPVLYGRLDVNHPKSTVDVFKGTFGMGQGMGGIYFAGATLNVHGAKFDRSNGIEQDNPASVVTVRDTTFIDYPRFAYHLVNGHADLGDGTNPGGNEFRLVSLLGVEGPVALVNDAPATVNGVMTDRFITVSAAKYNFPATLPDLPCTMTGLTQPPLYRLAKDAQLYFY